RAGGPRRCEPGARVLHVPALVEGVVVVEALADEDALSLQRPGRDEAGSVHVGAAGAAARDHAAAAGDGAVRPDRDRPAAAGDGRATGTADRGAPAAGDDGPA